MSTLAGPLAEEIPAAGYPIDVTRYGPSGSGRAGPRQRRVQPRQTDAVNQFVARA